jgi:hypothetical protein
MAGLNYYVKLPGYDLSKESQLDLSPISDAARHISKDMNDEENADIRRQQLDQQAEQNAAHNDIQRQTLAIAQDKAAREKEERTLQQTGGIMQYIKSLPADDPKRAQVWKGFVDHDPEIGPGLKQAGLDPYDHQAGPDFVLAKVQGWQDEQKKRESEARIKWYESKGQAVESNAATRRLKALGDLDQIGPNPTREQWESPQVQGLIQAAYPGARIPYERAGPTLIQAQQEFQRQFEPDAEEKAMGITRADKMEARRQEKLREMHGVEQKTLIGKNVRLRPDGSFEAIPGANTVGERNQEVIAKQGLERLDEGEKTLGKKGTFKQFFGDLEGHPGVSGYGEAGQGFRNVKAAIIDLNFALSGKSVSNKEREEFLHLYMPRWYDSESTQKQKMRMVRSYFKEVIKMRNSGATDEDLKARHDRALMEGEKIGLDQDEPSAKPTGKKGTPQGMSNEELLRKLNE